MQRVGDGGFGDGDEIVADAREDSQGGKHAGQEPVALLDPRPGL